MIIGSEGPNHFLLHPLYPAVNNKINTRNTKVESSNVLIQLLSIPTDHMSCQSINFHKGINKVVKIYKIKLNCFNKNNKILICGEYKSCSARFKSERIAVQDNLAGLCFSISMLTFSHLLLLMDVLSDGTNRT